MRDKVEQALYGGGFRTAGGAVLGFVLPGEPVDEAGGRAPIVVRAASERRTPGCVYFGQCGGCQYQHARYEVQVQWKREILGGLLAGAGIVDPPEITTLTGPEWGYRNRIRLRLEQVGGKTHAGYNQRRTNAFLPVSMCPIAAPLLWRAAEALLRLAASDNASARWMREAAEVEFFCSGDERRLQMQLFLRDRPSLPGRFNILCERLRLEVPELAGAGVVLAPELNRRARKAWAGESWGAEGLLYNVAGRDLWVSRGAFFQVDRFLIEALVDLVCKPAAGELAWDLYAGAGLFSRVLAERCGRVVAVEGGEAAARDLAIAARKGGFEARREAVLNFLRGREHQRERPSLVVVDPPRAGLGVEAATLLAKAGAERMVYVSCDPETLARDLAVLVRRGYRLERVTLVDLFPQTFHLETVVSLHR